MTTKVLACRECGWTAEPCEHEGAKLEAAFSALRSSPPLAEGGVSLDYYVNEIRPALDAAEARAAEAALNAEREPNGYPIASAETWRLRVCELERSLAAAEARAAESGPRQCPTCTATCEDKESDHDVGCEWMDTRAKLRAAEARAAEAERVISELAKRITAD